MGEGDKRGRRGKRQSAKLIFRPKLPKRVPLVSDIGGYDLNGKRWTRTSAHQQNELARRSLQCRIGTLFEGLVSVLYNGSRPGFGKVLEIEGDAGDVRPDFFFDHPTDGRVLGEVKATTVYNRRFILRDRQLSLRLRDVLLGSSGVANSVVLLRYGDYSSDPNAPANLKPGERMEIRRLGYKSNDRLVDYAVHNVDRMAVFPLNLFLAFYALSDQVDMDGSEQCWGENAPKYKRPKASLMTRLFRGEDELGNLLNNVSLRGRARDSKFDLEWLHLDGIRCDRRGSPNNLVCEYNHLHFSVPSFPITEYKFKSFFEAGAFVQTLLAHHKEFHDFLGLPNFYQKEIERRDEAEKAKIYASSVPPKSEFALSLFHPVLDSDLLAYAQNGGLHPADFVSRDGKPWTFPAPAEQPREPSPFIQEIPDENDPKNYDSQGNYTPL